MRPTGLLLRGFKGIKDGMGVDEIKLDFSALPNGTIVFSGENGKGKTTILDNMQPYRLMPSKVKKYSPDAFSYYEECFGEDACKDLHWVDRGIKYRTLIGINPTKKKQEAYLFRFDADGIAEPLNRDGKTGSYDEALEDILGKPELYFISDFRAQDAKYISDYSNGDIKAILAEFLGIDHIRTLSKNARQVAGELEKSLKALFEERQRLTDSLAGKEEKEKDLADWQLKAGNIEKEITEKNAEIAHAEQKFIGICSKEALQNVLIAKKADLSEELAGKDAVIQKMSKDFDFRLQSISNKISIIAEKIAVSKRLVSSVFSTRVEIERLRTEEKKKPELQRTVSETEKALSQVGQGITAIEECEQVIGDKERAYADSRHEMSIKLSVMQTQRDNMQRQADRLLSVPCNGQELAASCDFLKDAVEAAELLPGKKSELEGLTRRMEKHKEAHESEISLLRETCKDKGHLVKKEKELLLKVKEVRSQINLCDEAIEKIRVLEKDIADAITADRLIPEMEHELAELESESNSVNKQRDDELVRLNKEAENLRGQIILIAIDESLATDKADTEKSIATLKEKIVALREEEKAINRNIGGLESEVGAFPALEDMLKKTQERIISLGNDIAEWTILAKALGDDGIIALEIDDAGPAISKIANDLLREVYGNRFTVRIDTQNTINKKLKEEFDITVIDGRSNTTKSIKKVSGGEKELLEDLIPKAVGLFNRHRNGSSSQTLFTDERDGALDSTKKRAFFLMKNRVLGLGGYDQEFCITHTPELVKMADGVIELGDNGIAMYSNL